MKEREGEDAGGKEREYGEREGRRGNTEREREEGGIATRRRTEIQPAEWTVLIRIGVANEQYRCVAVRCGAFQYTEETRASAGFAELKWNRRTQISLLCLRQQQRSSGRSADHFI